MSSKWLRSPEDITRLCSKSPQNICASICGREQGIYANKAKQYNFLQDIYYSLYRKTTPQYILVQKMDNGEYKSSEMKFHPNCVNGC